MFVLLCPDQCAHFSLKFCRKKSNIEQIHAFFYSLKEKRFDIQKKILFSSMLATYSPPKPTWAIMVSGTMWAGAVETPTTVVAVGVTIPAAGAEKRNIQLTSVQEFFSEEDVKHSNFSNRTSERHRITLWPKGHIWLSNLPVYDDELNYGGFCWGFLSN